MHRQWTAFNEGDCWQVRYTPVFCGRCCQNDLRVRQQPSAMDSDSGGLFNNAHIGDVSDVHDYPNLESPAIGDSVAWWASSGASAFCSRQGGNQVHAILICTSILLLMRRLRM